MRQLCEKRLTSTFNIKRIVNKFAIFILLTERPTSHGTARLRIVASIFKQRDRKVQRNQNPKEYKFAVKKMRKELETNEITWKVPPKLEIQDMDSH